MFVSLCGDGLTKWLVIVHGRQMGHDQCYLLPDPELLGGHWPGSHQGCRSQRLEERTEETILVLYSKQNNNIHFKREKSNGEKRFY